MPPCIAHILYRTPTRIAPSRLFVRASLSRRYATTTEPERPAKDILTALYRTNATLARVLPSSEAASWGNIIGTSGDIISGALTRKPRIAVWGSVELSQQTELVSALLDDPLASDKRSINALRNRRRERSSDSVLTIRCGDFEESPTRLTLSLSWLRKLNADIVEIPATHPDFKTLLHDSDIQVIITSPLSAPLSRGLDSLLLSPSSLLIFNYPTLDHRTLDFTLSRLTALSPQIFDELKAKIFRVYPSKALAAVNAFREAPNSAAAVQAFQTDFLDSGVTALSQSISQLLSSHKQVLERRHARVVLAGALEACRDSVEDTSHDTAAAQMHVEELQARVHEATSRSVTEVLGGEEAPEVVEAMRKSTQEMRPTMDALKWWKLPFKVDDLADTFSRAAERAWCRDLEAKLQFQSGRLSVVRSILTAETHATLGLLPPPFKPAVLLNSLLQISARPPELSPTTLTHPIIYRLQQLQYPILSLHRRAQRILLAAGTTTVMSTGGAYATWFLDWTTPPTAAGLCALGIMMIMRWSVGNWEKGRTRWWQDWRRVGEGMDRDLKEMLAVVMQEKVTAVPTTAAEELSKVVATRRRDIEEMSADLENLGENLRNLYSQQHASTK